MTSDHDIKAPLCERTHAIGLCFGWSATKFHLTISLKRGKEGRKKVQQDTSVCTFGCILINKKKHRAVSNYRAELFVFVYLCVCIWIHRKGITFLRLTYNTNKVCVYLHVCSVKRGLRIFLSRFPAGIYAHAERNILFPFFLFSPSMSCSLSLRQSVSPTTVWE